MLKKLLGYEMKAYGRIMIPMYIALVGMSVLLGAFLRWAPDWIDNNLFFVFFLIMYVLMFGAVILGTFILIFTRFYGNVLGREGYFMLSLPTKTSTLLNAKMISALIWIIFGGIVGVGAVILTSMIQDFHLSDFPFLWNGIKLAIRDLQLYTGNIIYWCFILLSQAVVNIVYIYAAIAIGSQWSGHRLLGSILVYIGFGFIQTILLNILQHIEPVRLAINDADIWHSYGWQTGFLLVNVIFAVIFWFLAWYFVDRKLNLE